MSPVCGPSARADGGSSSGASSSHTSHGGRLSGAWTPLGRHHLTLVMFARPPWTTRAAHSSRARCALFPSFSVFYTEAGGQPMSITSRKKLLTAAEYEALVDEGILSEDDRVELIEGEVVEMSPIGPPHDSRVIRLTHLFTRLL